MTIEFLHVIFDTSGSFNKTGKKHMLNYLGNTVENLKFMFEGKTKFIFHTWNKEICEVESVERFSLQGIANVEALQNFLVKRTENEAVILITDGDFKGIKQKSFCNAVKLQGKRFAVIAAGYDAAAVQLQNLSPNFFFAEDMVTAFNIFLNSGKTL